MGIGGAKFKANGVAYSHLSLECSLDGAPLMNLQALKWAVKRESGKLFRRGKPIKRTRGRAEPTASMTLPLDDVGPLIDSIGDGWQEVEFSLVATFSNDGAKPLILEFRKVILGELSSETEETSTDPAMAEIDLDPIEMLVNGKSPLSN